MTVLYFLLLLGAALCFVLAAVRGEGYAAGRRTLNLVALGLFLWVLVPLIQTLDTLL